MNAMTPIEPATGLALLRTPFPPNQISKLPKETRSQIDARKANKDLMVWKCPICGGPHHKNALHLDYVGHAALTDRLLDADPMWTWEPVAFGPNGLPLLDATGGMWIKLTVCGVTRLGYGSADGKNGGDAVKEIIGDAMRNAAMRFGAALDLWHKGDLHADDESEAPAAQASPRHDPPTRGEPLSDAHRDMMLTMLEKSGADVRAFCQHFGIGSVKELPDARFDEAAAMLEKKVKAAARRAQGGTDAAQASDILADDIPY